MEIGIDWPNDQQLQAVWKILDLLKPGQMLVIREYAKKKPEIFRQSVKLYIQCYNTLEFNKEYTKVKRLNII